MVTLIADNTIFIKTLDGKAQLNQRSLALSMLQRRVLILCDGSRSVSLLYSMLNTPIEPIIEALVGLDLLVAQNDSQKPSSTRTRNAETTAASPLQGQQRSNATAKTVPTPLFSLEPIVQRPLHEQAQDQSGNKGQDYDQNQSTHKEPAHDISADELAQDFSEELTFNGSSEFEREISGFAPSAADHYGHADPSSTLQRAITARGVALGKAYLINIASTKLDTRDAPLLRSIGLIKTEGELYHEFERLIDTIGQRLGPSAINEILNQFDEEINRG